MSPDDPEHGDDAGVPSSESAVHRLERLAEDLRHLEHRISDELVDPDGLAVKGLQEIRATAVPAWRRLTQTEPRWPVSVAVLIMIGLQVALPTELTPLGKWLLPAIEAVLLGVLVASNPRRIDHRSPLLRGLGLSLIAIASLANAWSVIRLIDGLVHGSSGLTPVPLLATGANIWVTNVIIFALWYWEFDRGGPAVRAAGTDPDPDFLFPQMTLPQSEPMYRDWEPQFVDYLYVSFTNAAAFSPTDTMPLSRWAKLAMLAQSAVSLVTVALVIARAINILR
jgi:hypothetical protein